MKKILLMMLVCGALSSAYATPGLKALVEKYGPDALSGASEEELRAALGHKFSEMSQAQLADALGFCARNKEYGLVKEHITKLEPAHLCSVLVCCLGDNLEFAKEHLELVPLPNLGNFLCEGLDSIYDEGVEKYFFKEFINPSLLKVEAAQLPNFLSHCARYPEFMDLASLKKLPPKNLVELLIEIVGMGKFLFVRNFLVTHMDDLKPLDLVEFFKESAKTDLILKINNQYFEKLNTPDLCAVLNVCAEHGQVSVVRQHVHKLEGLFSKNFPLLCGREGPLQQLGTGCLEHFPDKGALSGAELFDVLIACANHGNMEFVNAHMGDLSAGYLEIFLERCIRENYSLKLKNLYLEKLSSKALDSLLHECVAAGRMDVVNKYAMNLQEDYLIHLLRVCASKKQIMHLDNCYWRKLPETVLLDALEDQLKSGNMGLVNTHMDALENLALERFLSVCASKKRLHEVDARHFSRFPTRYLREVLEHHVKHGTIEVVNAHMSRLPDRDLNEFLRVCASEKQIMQLSKESLKKIPEHIFLGALESEVETGNMEFVNAHMDALKDKMLEKLLDACARKGKLHEIDARHLSQFPSRYLSLVLAHHVKHGNMEVVNAHIGALEAHDLEQFLRVCAGQKQIMRLDKEFLKKIPEDVWLSSLETGVRIGDMRFVNEHMGALKDQMLEKLVEACVREKRLHEVDIQHFSRLPACYLREALEEHVKHGNMEIVNAHMDALKPDQLQDFLNVCVREKRLCEVDVQYFSRFPSRYLREVLEYHVKHGNMEVVNAHISRLSAPDLTDLLRVCRYEKQIMQVDKESLEKIPGNVWLSVLNAEIESGDMGFVNAHMDALQPYQLEALLRACVRERRLHEVDARHLSQFPSYYLGEALEDYVTRGDMKFVNAHMGALEEPHLKDVLRVCAREGSLHLVHAQYLGALEEAELGDLLIQSGPKYTNCILKENPELFDQIVNKSRLLTQLRDRNILDMETLRTLFSERKRHALRGLKYISEMEAQNKGPEAISGENLKRAMRGMEWWSAEVETLSSPKEIRSALGEKLSRLEKSYNPYLSQCKTAEEAQTIINGMGYVFRNLPEAQHLALLNAVEEKEQHKCIESVMKTALECRSVFAKEGSENQVPLVIDPRLLSAAVNLKHYRLEESTTQEAVEGLRQLAEDVRKCAVPEKAVGTKEALAKLYRIINTLLTEEKYATPLSDPFSTRGVLEEYYRAAILDGGSSAEPATYNHARCPVGLKQSMLLSLAKLHNIDKKMRLDIGCEEVPG